MEDRKEQVSAIDLQSSIFDPRSSRPNSERGKPALTIMPQELEEAKWFEKRKRPTAGKPWAW